MTTHFSPEEAPLVPYAVRKPQPIDLDGTQRATTCCRRKEENQGDPFMPALDSIAQHNALAPGPPCTMEKAFSHTSTTCTSRHPSSTRRMPSSTGALWPCKNEDLDSRKTKLGTSHPSLTYLCKEWPPCEYF